MIDVVTETSWAEKRTAMRMIVDRFEDGEAEGPAGNALGGEGARRFHVVVLGGGPVGKTSLINALLGRAVGDTGATTGTTIEGSMHTRSVEGVEGTLLLTDTPGLGDPGPECADRDALALELAYRADLVLFVVDQDLTRANRETMLELSRLGKRLIVVMNKKDRFNESDLAVILAKLRERLEGFVAPEDILAIAAAPSPVTVRVRKPDGTIETELEILAPQLDALEDRVAEILESEGNMLRAANLLLRARLCEQAERASLARQRRERAFEVIERHQWIAALTAFANPVLALAPMAAGAVQIRMLSEMGAIYDVPLSAESVEMVGRQMAQTLFKLGIAEAAASLVAGFLKFNPLGFAAGGAIQAVTMAYLTRLTGLAFLEYLEHGQNWGEGGLQGALGRHVEASRASDWVLVLAKATLARLFKK